MTFNDVQNDTHTDRQAFIKIILWHKMFSSNSQKRNKKVFITMRDINTFALIAFIDCMSFNFSEYTIGIAINQY